MKILILSDSHGNVDAMVRAVEQTSPERIFHLGDCWPDAEQLHAHFPEIPLDQVPGNCDAPTVQPLELLLELEGLRIFLCHGHRYRVKDSLLAAGYAAESQNLDCFLFGHTHRPFLEIRRGCLFLNPGSIGSFSHPSYALLHIQEGTATAELRELL